MTAHLIGVTNPSHSRTLQLIKCLSERHSEVKIVSWRTGTRLGFQRFQSLRSLMRLPVDVLLGASTIIKATIRTSRSDFIVLSHPSQLNLLVCWPFLVATGKRYAIDFYVSLHDTLVKDRAFVEEKSFLARCLRFLDSATIRFADKIIFDSESNAKRFLSRSSRSRGDCIVLYPEPPEFFSEAAQKQIEKTRDVIFIGHFSPLQGIETISQALCDKRLERYKFTIVGSGPSSEERHLSSLGENVNWIRHLDYAELPEVISQHRVSLGVFGLSEKAASVFPNKVVESLYCGVPVITRDGEISENFSKTGCITIPPGSKESLVVAIADFLENDQLRFSLENEAKVFTLGRNNCSTFEI